MSDALYDMHCHIGFVPDVDAFLQECAQAVKRPAGALSCSVTPHDYLRVRRAAEDSQWIKAAVGVHPWWIADGLCGEAECAKALELMEEARFVGEVGLDFSGQRATSAEAQTAFFREVCSRASAQSGKLLSIHAVQAAATVLDILEQTDTAAENTVIFHWFSGTSDDLQRAIALGCYFSLGPHMLATKRGRAYAKAIPKSRLLLETDAPAREGTPLDPATWTAMLEATLDELAAARDEECVALAQCVAGTSAALLDR